MKRFHLGNLPALYSMSLVDSSGPNAAVMLKTDTRHAAGAIPLNKIHSGICFIGDDTDTSQTGGTNDNVAGGQDNSGTPQSDSTETGGQQQEQQASTDNAQQDQSNDAGQQANSTATETAAGKVDTDESVDGRQPE